MRATARAQVMLFDCPLCRRISLCAAVAVMFRVRCATLRPRTRDASRACATIARYTRIFSTVFSRSSMSTVAQTFRMQRHPRFRYTLGTNRFAAFDSRRVACCDGMPAAVARRWPTLSPHRQSLSSGSRISSWTTPRCHEISYLVACCSDFRDASHPAKCPGALTWARLFISS